MCEIAFPEYVQRSLDDRFFSCLNYNRIRRVPTVQAALYIRLFHHFSDLQESDTQNSVVERRGGPSTMNRANWQREEPAVQRKAAAFNRWHELDESRGSSPDL
jgi:hypothetical protein